MHAPVNLRALAPVALVLCAACASKTQAPRPTAPPPVPAPPTPPPSPLPATHATVRQPPQGESRHLRNIRQMTLDGVVNAEPAPAANGRRVYFQSRRGGRGRAQVFVMDEDGRNVQRVSPAEGMASCPAAAPADMGVLFASTHLDDSGIPLPAGVLGDAALMEVYEAFADGSQPHALAPSPGYDGEGAYSPDGAAVVFISQRSGSRQVHLWTRNTGEVTQLTGGERNPGAPRFSPDGTTVVFAAGLPRELRRVHLYDGAVAPLTALEAHADSPVFHPDGARVLFSADLQPNTVAPGMNTDLHMLTLATGEVERITFSEGWDGFAAFSADGRTLWWTSNRQGGVPQVFAADWQD